MPNVSRIISPYIVSGNPDALAVPLAPSPMVTAIDGSSMYAPGDLGCSFDYNDKAYSLLILDSGATSANPVGAVQANQVAFWKDQANRIVTNDFRMSITPSAPSGAIAGIFRVAVPIPGPGGTLMALLVRGHGIPVVSGTVALGSQVMADSTASTAQVVTATGVLKPLGIARSTVNPALIDVDIPTLA
jgi:hypothetical protein